MVTKHSCSDVSCILDICLMQNLLRYVRCQWSVAQNFKNDFIMKHAWGQRTKSNIMTSHHLTLNATLRQLWTEPMLITVSFWPTGAPLLILQLGNFVMSERICFHEDFMKTFFAFLVLFTRRDTWISNYIHSFLWDVITYPCPNTNGNGWMV